MPGERWHAVVGLDRMVLAAGLEHTQEVAADGMCHMLVEVGMEHIQVAVVTDYMPAGVVLGRSLSDIEQVHSQVVVWAEHRQLGLKPSQRSLRFVFVEGRLLKLRLAVHYLGD